MAPSENKKTIDTFYAAFNAKDRERYCALLHPDFEVEISGSGEVSGHMDREAFSRVVFERVEEVFPGGLRVEMVQQIAEADSVACRVFVTGTTQGGNAYRNPACHVFRLADDRIVEMVEYFDTLISAQAFEEAQARRNDEH